MPVESDVHCFFCGASVGEISESTDEVVVAVFNCPKCNMNYCDQCSYQPVDEKASVQRCLRCESVIEKVT